MTTKKQLRSEIGDLRRNLDPGFLAGASRVIVERIQSMDAFAAAKTIALYKGIAGEVDLDALFPVAWELGKATCVPVFHAASRSYGFSAVTASTVFRGGNHGIREPETSLDVPLSDIDLIVVPGVAFDAHGNRLGRGGGYYDRLLDGFRGVSVAVALDFQIVPSVPVDLHDRPVDHVVTEKRTIEVQNEH